jgi:hypothetical protein
LGLRAENILSLFLKIKILKELVIMSNFKDFFKERKPIHNNEYVSNAIFLIKKSELKKSQLEFVNSFPMQEKLIDSFLDTLKNESRKDIITEFIPERILKDTDYNVLIMSTKTGNYLIQEQYYNFFQSMKCKVCIVNENTTGMITIYNSDIQFIGVLLPSRNTYLSNAIDYNEYLEEQKALQEAENQRKQNFKKCLYIKNNKAVVRNKELISIANITNNEVYKNLYVEKCIQENKDAEVYMDLGIVCIYVRTIQASYSNDKTVDYDYQLGYLNYKDFTLEKILTDIRGKRANNQFVNVADIKFMELSGVSEQEVKELIEYRQNWYNEMEKNEQEKRLQREQKDKDYVDTQNKITQDLVLSAEQAIINKQEIKNQDITIYKSRYNSSSTKLILYMMKQYNINVPLKTQGWINKALAKIEYNQEWNDYSYRYYKSSANSSVFNKYLNQLIRAIKEKHAVTITV